MTPLDCRINRKQLGHISFCRGVMVTGAANQDGSVCAHVYVCVAWIRLCYLEPEPNSEPLWRTRILLFFFFSCNLKCLISHIKAKLFEVFFLNSHFHM